MADSYIVTGAAAVARLSPTGERYLYRGAIVRGDALADGEADRLTRLRLLTKAEGDPAQAVVRRDGTVDYVPARAAADAPTVPAPPVPSVPPVPADSAAVEPAPADAGDGLDALSLAQLRDHAEKNGIDLTGASTKADTLAKIRAAG